MVRSYLTDPVDASLLDELLDLARRAPSAGFTQGVSFLVWSGPEEVQRFWDTTLPESKRATFPWPGLLRAPVIILPLGNAAAYVDRYGEPDKAATGLGDSPDAWAMEYWHIDTAMATMNLLNAAVDRGLGTLFFGLFDNEPAVSELAGLPDGVRPIGAVALGWPDGDDRPSKSTKRGRRPLDEIIHRGQWQSHE